MPALISLAAKILPLLAILSGSARLDRPLYIGGTDDLLQYDDGTAWWLTWDGLYRGVWFDTWDLMPGAGGVELQCLELWFYHYSAYPWDTSSFFAQVWNGGQEYPADSLWNESVMAAHYAPCYSYCYGHGGCGGLETERLFWILCSTELSLGGWPSILVDNTPNWTGNDHSFYSDDFVQWDPWVIQGPVSNDFFVRGDICFAVDDATWGAIKVLFQDGAGI